MTIDKEEQKKLLSAKNFVSGEENQTISQMPLPSGLSPKDCGVIMKDMMLTEISYPDGEVPTKNDFSGEGRAFMMTMPFRNPFNEEEIKTDLLAVCEDACGCKVDNFRALDFYQFQDMVKVGEQQYREQINLREMALKDKDEIIKKKDKQIKEERGDRNFDDDIWRKRVANLRKTATKDKLGEDADYKKMIDMANEMGELGNGLRDAEETIDKQKRVMENLTRSIKEKDEQLELAKKTMEEATASIIALDGAIKVKEENVKELTERVDELFEENEEKDTEISNHTNTRSWIDRDIRSGAFDVKTTWGYVVDILDSIGYGEEHRFVGYDNTIEIVEECCGVIDWTINKYVEGATNGETLIARIYDNIKDRCRELVEEGKLNDELTYTHHIVSSEEDE
tara:strand:+ start:1651 stop:2838 length:1188 start_codon:yes stop_codon:yes gene_type:complete